MPLIASPHEKMKGFARLRNRTLLALSYSVVVSLIFVVVITTLAGNDLLLWLVGVIVFAIGLILTVLANAALLRRNSAWRPLKKPAVIGDIVRAQTTRESVPGEVVESTKIVFSDSSSNSYELIDELGVGVTIGARVVGDILISEDTVRQLRVAP